MKRKTLVIGAAALAACGAAAFVTSASVARGGPAPKVIVLGFDGVDHGRTATLLAAGRLPNLAALAARGGFAKLASANPAQSPVSWATLTTGLNPGKTGIYDFLRPIRPPAGPNVSIDIGLGMPEMRSVLSPAARAGAVALAGLVGAAAGTGVVLALYAGARRARRPRGLLQGAMTGTGAVFAAVAYVVLAWVPAQAPYPVNLRDGESYWKTLDRNGVRCVALDAPLSFPADDLEHGACLSGLGVPDVEATWGSFSVWTDDPTAAATTEFGGTAWFVPPGVASFDLVLKGPKNPLADRDALGEATRAANTEKFKREGAHDWSLADRRLSESEELRMRLADRLTAVLRAEVTRGVGVKVTTADGATASLVPGTWSDLVAVEFKASPVVRVAATVRFLLESVPSADGPPKHLRLFVATVQFDAAKLPPNVPLASPREFGRELVAVNGEFETAGWPEMTSPVKDGMLSDRAFLSHIEILRTQREKRFLERLRRSDWDAMFGMFAEPDRVQHALYRHLDTESPLHVPAEAPEFAGAIDGSYEAMDRFVGEVMRAAPPDAAILVVSDHGFAPFRRGVNLNNFLCSIGLQSRTGGAGPRTLGNLGGAVFTDVDWAHTSAYAMGLGNVYLNLAGREAQGTVQPADAGALLAQIEQGLLALRDAKGERVVRSVYRGKDLFKGPRAAAAPDLVVGFEWGYRVSWQTCMGGLDAAVIVPNVQCWTGDHCSVDPPLVPGILFSSLPLAPGATPGVADLAPSVLSLYGVKPVDTDGTSFLAK